MVYTVIQMYFRLRALLGAIIVAFAIAVLMAVVAFLMPAEAAVAAKLDYVTLSADLEKPLAPGQTAWVAIRQEIAPGWHTYWRNPGASGLATSAEWALPVGVTAGAILWPAPERFSDGTITSYGYAREATLLVPLNAAAAAKPDHAQVTVSLLICEHMCIPEQATLVLDLQHASGSPDVFAKAREALPRPYAGSAHLIVQSHTVELHLNDPSLRGVPVTAVQFFPATTGVLDEEVAPHQTLKDGALIWTAARREKPKPLQNFEGVLTIAGKGAFAVTAISMLAPAAGAMHPSSSAIGLAAAILLAFVGGLILNLMPCVLPILSMKALALARTGSDVAGARREGLFYFAGVMATFGAIAGTLLVLKASGVGIGWGFQLQSPIVVLLMTLLMAAIGLNLLGVFEVPMGLAGAGESLTRGGGARGAFFTGALAVVVASPCTAPFMGAALGFAFTQSALVAFIVFLALGFGFALPFAAVSATPALIRLIPKPGLWMNRLKQALAFPMFATAIWLLWVLGRQRGPDLMAISLAIGLGLVLTVWLIQQMKGFWRWGVVLAGAICIVATATLMESTAASSSDVSWKPWSAEALAEARKTGRPVLVDFSAAWCVTCLVNERVALQNPTVTSYLAQKRVITLKGDWTNPDPTITTELRRYGRDGVPLYLLYPPNGQAIMLPQILTPGMVLAALSRINDSPR